MTDSNASAMPLRSDTTCGAASPSLQNSAAQQRTAGSLPGTIAGWWHPDGGDDQRMFERSSSMPEPSKPRKPPKLSL